MGGKGGLSGMGGAGYAVALPSTPAPSKHVVQCSISGPAQVAHCGWQWWHIS